MGITSLFINFDELEHPISLFVGDSGSGKSSIIRSIHPFAYNNAAGEDALANEFIMDGRDGRKIATYEMDGKEIVCDHRYLRANDKIQTKSFFSIENEELNPSGLTTTFKDYVWEYFKIDENFLSLLSIGNQVDGFVEYTASERKKAAVRLFSELNIYMEYYKNTQKKVKELKTVLDNVVSKLSRYGSYDKKDIQKQIRELKRYIQTKESELSSILRKEGAVSSELSTYEKSYLEYESCEKEVHEILKSIEQIRGRRHTDMEEPVIDTKKEEILKLCIESELRISTIESSIKTELKFKEQHLETKDLLERTLTRQKEHTDRLELHKLKAEIDTELAGLSDIKVNAVPDPTKMKEQLVIASAYLNNLKGMCTELVTDIELPDLIIPTLENYTAKKNYAYSVDASIAAISDRINQITAAHQLQLSGKLPEIPKEIDTNCKVSCIYRDWYNTCKEITGSMTKKVEETLREERHALKESEQKQRIIYIIKKLYKYIDDNWENLKVLPEDIFNTKTFIQKFFSTLDRQVHDEDRLSSLICIMESTSRKKDLLQKKKEVEDRLAGLENIKQQKKETEKDLKKVEQELVESEEHLTMFQENLEFHKVKYEENQKLLKDLDTELKVAKELTELRTRLAEIKSALSTMDDNKVKFESLSKEVSELKNTETELRAMITKNREELNRLTTLLETLESLEQEQIYLSEHYYHASLIKEAVSPSEGIPVEFIDEVIRNQMIDDVNDLVQVAYPSLEILKGEKDLIINEKEFTIPYKKDGIRVADISKASGGEKAMLKVAFSLVLVRLVSTVYNLVLIDEMDAFLDKYGRSRYIDIIERYRKKIKASQMFVISHNNMFDMYDVNILRTTPGRSGKPCVKLYEGGNPYET